MFKNFIASGHVVVQDAAPLFDESLPLEGYCVGVIVIFPGWKKGDRKTDLSGASCAAR